MTWRQFLETALPVSNHPNRGDHNQDPASQRIRESVTARRLVKIARLTFVPTNELRDHLKLDARNGTVQLYHHTAFLKESLIASRKNTQ
jgi:hypothetical protein